MSNMEDSYKLELLLKKEKIDFYKSDSGLVLFNVYGPNGGVSICRVFYILKGTQYWAIELIKVPLDLDEVLEKLDENKRSQNTPL